MKENKQAIIKSLTETLRLTQAGQDIDRLELTPNEDYVYICYLNGYKVQVTAEASGLELIRDIADRV